MCMLTFRKSVAVSPTVVAMILMIQMKSVTSGTLLSMYEALFRKGIFMGDILVSL